jgi:hypothetical protein
LLEIAGVTPEGRVNPPLSTGFPALVDADGARVSAAVLADCAKAVPIPGNSAAT